jgi:hypothetical protein
MSETPKVGNQEREPANRSDDVLQQAAQEMRGAAAKAGSQASEATSRLRDEVAGAASDVKAEAAAVVDAARERATGFAEQQKHVGAQHAESVARAVHRAADELQNTSPQIALYVREAASSVGQLAQTMRDRSMPDLVGEVESIARQQPVAFFGAAVLAGFALSRFVKSSAEGLAASTASAPTRSSPAPTATSTGTVGGSVTPAAAPRQADMSGEQGI